ncbi:MAG: hypothetical protein RLY97_1144, partial [Pseudomonadota bacterium]
MNTLYDDFRSALHSVWQRRGLSLAVAWAICLIGWAVVWMIPSTYKSDARIFVQLYDPLSTQVGMGDADRKHSLDQIRDTLTSAQHLEQVVKSTPLGNNITSRSQMESAVAGLSKAIKVTAEQDNLFEISATSASLRFSPAENAKLSRDIVAKMIDIFRVENLNGNKGQIKQTMEFLDQQLAQRNSELQAAEQRRLVFESKYPELASGGTSVIQRLESTRTEMRNIDADIIAASSSLASINAQIASTPQSVSGLAAGNVGGTRGALAQIQSELASMRARGMT